MPIYNTVNPAMAGAFALTSQTDFPGLSDNQRTWIMNKTQTVAPAMQKQAQYDLYKQVLPMTVATQKADKRIQAKQELLYATQTEKDTGKVATQKLTLKLADLADTIRSDAMSKGHDLSNVSDDKLVGGLVKGLPNGQQLMTDYMNGTNEDILTKTGLKVAPVPKGYLTAQNIEEIKNNKSLKHLARMDDTTLQNTVTDYIDKNGGIEKYQNEQAGAKMLGKLDAKATTFGDVALDDFGAAPSVIGGAVTSAVNFVPHLVSSVVGLVDPATGKAIADATDFGKILEKGGLKRDGWFDAGKFATDTAISMATATKLLQGVNSVSKIAQFATKYPGREKWAMGPIKQGLALTEAGAITSKGRFATPVETAIGVGSSVVISGLLNGVASLKDKLYNQAFRQTPNKLGKITAKFEGQTPGEVVANSGLPSTTKLSLHPLKNLQSEVGDRLSNTWSTLEGVTKNTKVDGATLRGSMSKDVLKMLGVDEASLPVGSTIAKETTDKVNKAIMSYIPDGQIPGDKVVNTIKAMNKTLGDKLIEVGLANPKNANTITEAMKISLKSFLDEAATAGGVPAGTVNTLYQNYASDKTIQSILDNKAIQKIMLREMIGGGFGAIPGLMQLSQGDIQGGIKTTLLGGAAGIVGGRLSANADFLMMLGNILEKAGNPGAIKLGTALVTEATPSLLSNNQ